MSTLTSQNPYTGSINATFDTIDTTALEAVIQQAHSSYLSRNNTEKSYRKMLCLKLADVIEADLEGHAKIQTMEMGMLYTSSLAWLKATVSLIRWFANNFESILANELRSSEGMTGHYQYDSLGIIYGIAPWNFPYNQLLRAAVPNILAGNTVIYKHASNVPLCAQAIEQRFKKAGFPDGVYSNLFIETSQSEYILAHPYVRGVNITGGERAGSAIASLAGKYLKPSVLELGGNDAFILLDHTDTNAMVAAAVHCRISNAGQRCNSSKRFIILEAYYERFCEEYSNYMQELVVGDPMDPNTQLGPLATTSMLHEVHRQVQESVAQGARLLTGGTIIDEEKKLYAATVLADVTPAMTSYQQEVFGPVASIILAKDIEDAIRIANDNDFALSAVVYGDNHEQCKQVANRLEGGMIFINQPAGSKASLPFGGVKKSGYGKENGAEGLKAFTNKKVILY